MNFGFNEPDVPAVSVDNVHKAMQTGEKLLLLDVRTSAEHARNRIKGSINIPVDEVGNSILDKLPDKNQKVYVYCLSGARSIVAVNTMIKLGYTNVYNMNNGLLAWRVKKFPLIQ